MQIGRDIIAIQPIRIQTRDRQPVYQLTYLDKGLFRESFFNLVYYIKDSVYFIFPMYKVTNCR